MINPKFYKLAGWGMIISSFYFTWPFFVIGAVVLHNLVTNGGSGISSGDNSGLTPVESISGFIKILYLNILLGPALIIGGRFALKRMGTRTKGDRCKDQI